MEGVIKMKVLAIIFMMVFSVMASANEYGEFFGSVKVEWLEDFGPDRNMKLLEDFTYKDPSGNLWTVPKGTIVNGASIPSLFWTTFGSPFVGDYRYASVVHDYFCDQETFPWKNVHRIFYYGILATGVSQIKAKLMYTAVYVAGPRWASNEPSDPSCRNCHAGSSTSSKWTPSYDKGKVEQIREWIEEKNPDLSEIESKLDVAIKNPGPH